MALRFWVTSPGGIRAIHTFRAIILVVTASLLLAACAGAPEIPPSERPLAKETMMLLGHKGMDAAAPIFVRIFKQESELEVWKARDDGRFYHFKTYPICNWSGDVGPKLRQGDKQAPEGFYTVTNNNMNPNSDYHVAFNLGYPNAYDRSKGRTGNFLMVHGGCTSAGCYAMTDALVEEIYALAREAFRAGQPKIEVHAYPFRMTDTNMARYKKNRWYSFWRVLKRGYDHFEHHRLPPSVAVCERRYVVNVSLPENRARPNPTAACPRFKRPLIEPFVARPSEEQIASERIVVPGTKKRQFAAHQTPAPGAPYGGTITGLIQALGGPKPSSSPTDDVASPAPDVSLGYSD